VAFLFAFHRWTNDLNIERLLMNTRVKRVGAPIPGRFALANLTSQNPTVPNGRVVPQLHTRAG
jgi:hypothetical protein